MFAEGTGRKVPRVVNRLVDLFCYSEGFENRVAVVDPAVLPAVDRQGHAAGALAGAQRALGVAGQGENHGLMQAGREGAWVGRRCWQIGHCGDTIARLH